MLLQESGEMYLETILLLSKKLAVVRSIDVSEQMGYSKPSVSRAVGLLKDGGYLEVGADGALKLTKKGYETASKVYSRHTALKAFLEEIGVSPDTAEADACKIEHVISDETYLRVQEYIKKLS